MTVEVGTSVLKLKSGSVFEEKRSYSRAVVIGNWIMLANTAGRNYATRAMSLDPAEQARQCFANIEGALAAVNATLSDVVRARIAIPFLEHKESVMDVVAEKFRGIDPASTITATPLSSPDYLVEIEVTAYRDAGSGNTEYIRVNLGERPQ